MLNKNMKKAFYMQISEFFESKIRSGYFVYGQKLPTLTEIKKMFNVSLKVATQAYEELNKNGFIFSKRGKGYYVSFYHHMQFQLETIHHLEADLVYDHQMERQIYLFEVIKADNFIASKLKMDVNKKCYHIKQTYGKQNENIMVQEIFLPFDQFSELIKKYQQYKTIPSLIMNGYRYNINEFKNKFYARQASSEHDMFLRLQKDAPLWHIESLCLSDQEKPLVFINQYLSGKYVEMGVMIHVN